MKFLKGLGLFALALCFNCASTTSVLSEFDESADFDNYKTYVLCIDDLFVDNTKYPKLDNNYVRELIGAEIEEQMESQGYKTNVLRPELQAGFKISIRRRIYNYQLRNS